MIYFIRCTGSGKVKIGKSFDVLRRVAELQVGNPSTLIVEAEIDGYTGLEAYLHKKCDERRGIGEWFDLTQAEVSSIVRFVGECQKIWATNEEARLVREIIAEDALAELEHLEQRCHYKLLEKARSRLRDQSEQSEQTGPAGIREGWMSSILCRSR